MKHKSLVILSQLRVEGKFPQQLSLPLVAPQKSAPTKQSKKRSLHKSQHHQLDLFSPPQPTRNYPLRIELLPPTLQWWDAPRYWLIHDASGLRVPGTWTKAEAELMQDLSKNWNWSVDSDRRVTCGVQLMALAEGICKRSAIKGGKHEHYPH